MTKTDTHNAACEYAKGDLCRCSCEGERHGIKDKPIEPQKTIVGFANMDNSIIAKCPKCGLVKSVSIDLLNSLWDEGSQLTIKCKKCNTFYRSEWS